jgi:hypothetical protein
VPEARRPGFFSVGLATLPKRRATGLFPERLKAPMFSKRVSFKRPADVLPAELVPRVPVVFGVLLTCL